MKNGEYTLPARTISAWNGDRRMARSYTSVEPPKDKKYKNGECLVSGSAKASSISRDVTPYLTREVESRRFISIYGSPSDQSMQLLRQCRAASIVAKLMTYDGCYANDMGTTSASCLLILPFIVLSSSTASDNDNQQRTWTRP